LHEVDRLLQACGTSEDDYRNGWILSSCTREDGACGGGRHARADEGCDEGPTFQRGERLGFELAPFDLEASFGERARDGGGWWKSNHQTNVPFCPEGCFRHDGEYAKSADMCNPCRTPADLADLGKSR
jgi:hypothetical protein